MNPLAVVPTPESQELTKVAAEFMPTLYEDLGRDAAQRIGKTLGQVIGIVTTPVGILVQTLEQRLARYARKISRIPAEDLVAPPLDLAVPILERLKYTTSEEIAELFTELLAKASDRRTRELAHPGFVELISCLSGDEAKIVEFLARQKVDDFPCLELRYLEQGDPGTYKILDYHYTDLHTKVDLLYPQNINMYVDNLCRLGVLAIDKQNSFAVKPIYSPLRQQQEYMGYKRKYGELFTDTERVMVTTAFGRNFTDACVAETMAKQPSDQHISSK